MVFYITISGDIAINGHKRNSLVEMHRWFCNRDSYGNTPAGVCESFPRYYLQVSLLYRLSYSWCPCLFYTRSFSATKRMKKFLSEGSTSCSIDKWVNCRADAEKKSENQFSLSRKSRINHVKTQVVTHHSRDPTEKEPNQHSKDSFSDSNFLNSNRGQTSFFHTKRILSYRDKNSEIAKTNNKQR